MTSPPSPIADLPAPRLPSPIVDLPAPRLLSLTDELLEEIFLRLPTPTDLARASTACGSFRRVITDRGFLRRFDAVHTPPFVGFIPERRDGFYPAQPPYPSAPLARAVANAADFSYSFVPIGRWRKPWRPRDHRQGRVLLECLPLFFDFDDFDEDITLTHLELVVCDPLHRRYVLLPSVPQEITVQHGLFVDFVAFLAPAGQGEEEETSFKVICTARNGTNLFAFVFSSVTGQWCIAASPSWSSLGTEAPAAGNHMLAYPDYACGCFYWTRHWVGKSLVFDARKMEFSIVNSSVPPSCLLIEDSMKSGIVAGAEGTPLMFFLGRHKEDECLDILHITKLNTNEPSDQQQMEKIIPLARRCRYSIVCGAVEGFLFLHYIPGGQPLAAHRQHWFAPTREYFLLDVQTSERKKICEMEHAFFRVHPFSGFAQSLLKPCV